MLRAGPRTSMRGPGTSPALIASRSATSLYPRAPTLRTVVKPASSVSRALCAPVSASRGTDEASISYPKCGSKVRWVCASMSPGRIVAFDYDGLIRKLLACLHVQQLAGMNNGSLGRLLSAHESGREQ